MDALRQLPRFAAIVALYVGGAFLAAHVLHGPDRVALVWLPAGVAIATLLILGRRLWPLILVADLASQLALDAPLLFLPFSAAANTLAALVGATVARRMGGAELAGFAVRTGFVVLAGGLALAGTSALIGVAGLVAAGMSPADQVGPALSKWFIANLFGVVLVAPALRLALMPARALPAGETPLRYAGRREIAAWAAVAALSALLLAGGGHLAQSYVLGLASLPLALLVWSALRFPPMLTALASLALGIALVVLAGTGAAGFPTPPTLYDAVVLLVFLSTVSLAPLFLAAAVFENQVAARRVLRAARRDELTGLANRVGFEGEVRPLLEGGGEEPMALAYIDLDQFKLVNDTASHAVGDELVRSLAGVLQARLAPQDRIARIGGDEFAVLLRRRLPLEAERAAEGMRQAIADFRLPHHGHVYTTTASIGLVPFLPRRLDYPSLLAQADAACFGAKERGGNRVHLVGAAEAAQERSSAMLWAMRLTTALEQGGFQLHCQSIAPLHPDGDDGRHFEILLRMTDPQTGAQLMPDQFVAAAERFRLGGRLDRHVVEQTLAWLERHPEHLPGIALCSINLCGTSVGDPEFLVFLRSRLARSSVPARKLCFEITETSAIRDLGEARRFVDGVRALGCRLALDDFGTGFCSFAYLNALDVDYFKIDGSFVRELDASPLSLSIVRAIADIARGIDRRTIAEFVSSDSIRMRLIDLGVDYAQGYAIDRPTPIDDYFALPPPHVARPPLAA